MEAHRVVWVRLCRLCGPSKPFQWRCGNLLRLNSEKVILITKQSAHRIRETRGEAAAMSAGKRCGVDSGGGDGGRQKLSWERLRSSEKD